MLLCPLLAALSGGALWADDVYLNNGSVFEGVIAQIGDTHVTIEMGLGKIRFPLEQVTRVVKAQTPLSRFLFWRDELLASPTSAPDRWLELARYARTHELQRHFRETTLLLARIAPQLDGLEPLMEEIGFLYEDHSWRPREEVLRARGLVPFGGEWITPDERDSRLEQARLEDDLRRAAAERRPRRSFSDRAAARSSDQPSDNSVALASIELAREVVASRREQAEDRPRTLAAPAGYTLGADAFYIPSLPLSGSFGFVVPVGRSVSAQELRESIRKDIAAASLRQPGSFLPLEAFRRDLKN